MFTVLALMQLCDNLKSRENLPCPLCLLRILLTPFFKRNASRRCQVRLPLVPGLRLLYGSRSPSGRSHPVGAIRKRLTLLKLSNSEKSGLRRSQSAHPFSFVHIKTISTYIANANMWTSFHLILAGWFKNKMVDVEGLEPSTFGLGNRRSVLLSYTSIMLGCSGRAVRNF